MLYLPDTFLKKADYIMPEITGEERFSVLRVHPFRPVVTGPGCLCHPMEAHTGSAIGVHCKERNCPKLVLRAIFCHAISAGKRTAQVTCWQMPERAYLNSSRYGVEV